MDRTTIFLVLLLLGTTGLPAQKFPSRGVPFISNYPPEQYGATGKTWEIQAAENGILYFATDRGLLEFDGNRWIHFAGSKGFTRSILIESDSIVYTGADKDFGRWERDDLQRFNFTSLNPFRESTKGLNEEFWGTYKIDDDHIFVSFDNIYVHKKQQLTKIAAPSRFYGSCTSGSTIYLFDDQSGLFSFDGLSLTALFNFPDTYPEPPKIIGVHNTEDGLFVITRGRGTFLFAAGRLTPINAEVSPFLKRDQVFSFTPIAETHYAFGTILNGVYITDREGRIIQHVNKQKGLLNNTVLSMLYTPRGKLWLGLDFGISAIDLWSDVTYFLDERGQVGTGYTGRLYQDRFYLGTNQGLYFTDWENFKNGPTLPDFQLVTGSAGQVWDLAVVEDELLCGHDRGLFRVTTNNFTQLHDEAGVLTISSLNEGHLITGNYNGISLFQKTDKGWTFSRKIPPVQGSCNQILRAKDQTLWLNLPNFGVIKASLDDDYQITNQQIFPATLFAGPLPQLFQDGDTLKVTTGASRYAYLASAKTFQPIVAPHAVHPIANRLEGAHRPAPLNDAYGFVPVQNGFALKNIGYEAPSPAISPLSIRSIAAFNNDTTQLIVPGGEVSHQLNNLRLHFIVPHQQQVVYQYQLENHAQSWSDWSSVEYVEFLNLSGGGYRFHLRAKVGEQIIAEQSVAFSVAGPWHRTPWAYAGYALLVFTFLFLNRRWQQRQLSQQKQQLRAQEKISQRLQLAAKEQEKLHKRYVMLEDALGEIKKQLRTKTLDLARKAKENDEKSRILQTLKEKVKGLAGKTIAPSKFEWVQLSRILDNYPETEDKSFNLQMEELHQDFLLRLNARFPELTTYDQRLCVYLKSGLTTREIAELMNVLPSSVNVSRSRLRKKLNLAPREDLYKFLQRMS